MEISTKDLAEIAIRRTPALAEDGLDAVIDEIEALNDGDLSVLVSVLLEWDATSVGRAVRQGSRA